MAHRPVAPEPELVGLLRIPAPRPSGGLLLGTIEETQAGFSYHHGQREAYDDHRRRDEPG